MRVVEPCPAYCSSGMSSSVTARTVALHNMSVVLRIASQDPRADTSDSKDTTIMVGGPHPVVSNSGAFDRALSVVIIAEFDNDQ